MTFLETRRIRLRPIDDKDLQLLHRWRNEPDYMRFCSNRRHPVNLERFAAELKKDFDRNRHLQFIIERKEGRVPIGTIFSHDFNLIDGYVFMTCFIAEGYRHQSYGAEAGILLLCYLFDNFPLHKVYCETFSYNDVSLSTLHSGGFVEEGRFKDHRFFEGKRYDLIRLAAYRDGTAGIRRILQRLQVKK